MAAYGFNIIQINVAPLPLPCVHCQLGIAADDVQGGADVVRHGKDDVLAHFQQCGILLYRLLQPFPRPCPFMQVFQNDQVGNDEQHDGEDNQPRDDMHGTVVGGFKMPFLFGQDTLGLAVHRVYQGAELVVEFPVMTAQAVGVSVYGFLPSGLHGEQFLVQRLERDRSGRGNFHSLFRSEQSGNAFLLAGDGLGAGFFGQAGKRQSGRAVLSPEHLHDLVQMLFLVFQEITQSVYLVLADKYTVFPVHGLQHGIDTHTERTVVLEIFLLPGKGGLAAHGKERDVPVGGIHIMLHPVDAFHFRLYPKYPAALIQQGGGHASYD